METTSKLAVSVVVVLAFVAYVVLVVMVAIPSDMRDVVNTAGGTLGAAFMTVVNYWMGSSASSAKKDETIAAQIKPEVKP